MNLLLQTLAALVTFGLSGWLLYWAGRHDERKGLTEYIEAEVQRRLKARDDRIESKLAESLARAALSKLKDRLPLPGTECCALEGGYPVNQTNEE